MSEAELSHKIKPSTDWKIGLKDRTNIETIGEGMGIRPIEPPINLGSNLPTAICGCTSSSI